MQFRGAPAGVAARPYAHLMPGEVPPSVQQILATRSGEELALGDRYLNPQMGRILRTLGFDKVWSGGRGRI